MLKESNKFKIIDELIFHEKNQIYVSKTMKIRILTEFHVSFTAKHFEKKQNVDVDKEIILLIENE